MSEDKRDGFFTGILAGYALGIWLLVGTQDPENWVFLSLLAAILALIALALITIDPK